MIRHLSSLDFTLYSAGEILIPTKLGSGGENKLVQLIYLTALLRLCTSAKADRRFKLNGLNL